MEKRSGMCVIFTMFVVMLMLGAFLVITAPNNVTAASEGGYTYTTGGSPTVSTITGYTGAGGAITIPATLGTFPAVAIGNNAFSSSTVITSVAIGNVVTSIGDWAFWKCSILTSVSIGSGVVSIGTGAFTDDPSLIGINVDPANLKYANSGSDGVLYNKALTTLIQCPGGKAGAFTIPNSVTATGNHSFYKCTALTSVTIGSGVKSIGNYSFTSCTGLTSFNIPNSVKNLGNGSFWYCSALASVTIGNGITSIGMYTFSECTALTSIVIPNSVTSIGVVAFGTCTALTSITMPSSLTTIDNFVFYQCTALTSITIPASVTSIGESAFYQCSSLTSITIPASVTSIEFLAFAYCTNLTSITIPASVKFIGNRTFESCTSLTSITIPGGVTSIGYRTFDNCTNLTSIAIPANVMSIGYSAFQFCTALTSITFLGLVAPTSVDVNWILNTSAGILGHAYAASNFPAPGSTFYGLMMGVVIPTVPGTPTNLSATPGNAQVALAWDAPVSTGGSAVTGYNVYRSTAESGTFALISSPLGLNYTDTGRTNGQMYWYNVSAVNAIGEGAKTALVSSTPCTLPNAPTGLKAIAGTAQVILNWTAPTFNGGNVITGYKIYRSTTENGVFSLIATTTALNYTDTGRTNGQTYWYNVSAVNAIGEGGKTALVSSTPCTVPNAPTGLSSTMINGQVTLEWTAPASTGGSPVIRYNVYRGISSTIMILIGNSTSATFVDTATTAGSTYFYKVSAVNAAGEGNQSASTSTSIPSMLPVSGKIIDSSGNGMAGISVALENGTSVTTDAQGGFVIMTYPGNHTLTISGSGIETKDVVVIVNAPGLALGNIAITKIGSGNNDVLVILAVVVIAALLVAGLLYMRQRKR
jgi:fibronectin type 3 domain-containing protein